MTTDRAADPQIPVVFAHGAGATPDDPPLPALRRVLGTQYSIAAPDLGLPDPAVWSGKLKAELTNTGPAPILIGHSLGGSHMLKCLAELGPMAHVRGFVGLACPLWGQPDWSSEDYALPDWAPEALARLPMRLFHARDDKVVAFDHLAAYGNLFPQARRHPFATGGHMMETDLSAVAIAMAEL